MDKEELIEKYLQGLLNPEEEKMLQELKVLDNEFKKELDFQFAIKQALILEKEDNLKAQLLTFEQHYSKENKIIPNLLKWAAAAVFVIGLVFTIFLFNRPKTNVDELFIAYFNPAENIHYPITRGVSDDLLIGAFTNYELGQFEQALTLFQILDQTGEYEDLKLYIGSSHLALGQINEALEALNPKPYQNSPMEIRFKWYQSLALIKAGKTIEAQRILVEIAENKGYQSENASSILEKLPIK